MVLLTPENFKEENIIIKQKKGDTAYLKYEIFYQVLNDGYLQDETIELTNELGVNNPVLCLGLRQNSDSNCEKLTENYSTDFQVIANPSKITDKEKKLVLFYDKICRAIKEAFRKCLTLTDHPFPEISDNVSHPFSFSNVFYNRNYNLNDFDYPISPIFSTNLNINSNYKDFNPKITQNYKSVSCHDLPTSFLCFYTVKLSHLFHHPHTCGFLISHDISSLSVV